MASRWWQQFLAIPWPDKLFHSVACFVDGFDEDARMLRRSLLRYMNLALILVLRSISSAVKQRFPTLEHVVEAGFMTNQVRHFLIFPCMFLNPNKFFQFIRHEKPQGTSKKSILLKFIYSEKATKFCEFFPLLLTTVHTVKRKGKISQNFVAFSEYMNFMWNKCLLFPLLLPLVRPLLFVLSKLSCSCNSRDAKRKNMLPILQKCYCCKTTKG